MLFYKVTNFKKVDFNVESVLFTGTKERQYDMTSLLSIL